MTTVKYNQGYQHAIEELKKGNREELENNVDAAFVFGTHNDFDYGCQDAIRDYVFSNKKTT